MSFFFVCSLFPPLVSLDLFFLLFLLSRFLTTLFFLSHLFCSPSRPNTSTATTSALEPVIPAEIMQLHHSKHHQAYVDNLNKAIAGTPHEGKSLEELVRHAGQISTPVRNNGGGHWNHSFFWESLAPGAGGTPTGKLLEDINAAFGSFEGMKEKFNAAGMGRFGSGWAWLIVKDGKLEISSTPNQDNPLMDVAEVKGTPLLGADVWEHAYYLKYQNRRADYLAAFWNLVNWSKVASRY